MSSLRVLIVEDSPADFNLYRRRLEQGFSQDRTVEIQHCVDGSESLEALKNSTFDCIILDYLLGAEDGLDLLPELLKISPDTPVILMTGAGDEKIAVKAMKLGAYDYLTKESITSEAFASSVRNAISKASLSKKLKEKQNDLENFAYTAAHDIKSPLATINLTAQLLEMRASEIQDDKISEFAATINRVSMRLGHLVEDLLNYAKSGRDSAQFQKVDLNGVVALAKQNLTVLITEHNAEIEVQESLPIVYGDETALTQLFQNLVANGIKFHRKNVAPQVQINYSTVTAGNSCVAHKISISDNGIGIDLKDQKRIFSPLTRLQATESVDGSGLGLTIVEKIVEQHNGEINLSSQVGVGTTFTIYLPNSPELGTP